MSDIARVVEICLDINGSIRLKPYKKVNCKYLSSCVLWDYIRINKYQKTMFDDDSWYSQGNKLSITFNDIDDEYQYQLKAMAIGMYMQGSGEGMDPLSWATIRKIIGTLKRLGKRFQRYQINSFFELNSVPELKLRNIIVELVQSLKLQKHPSYSEALFSAIHWLKIYGVVELNLFFELMNEYIMPFRFLAKERRNKHSVIPVEIMKQVLSTCEKHILAAEDVFDNWCMLQNKLNAAIPRLPSSEFKMSTFIDALNQDEAKKGNNYHILIKNLRRYTFVLVLSYTGMRYGEVTALTDDSAIDKNGKYYLKSLLSKTTDNTQSLEWITNEIVYKAVSLMSRVNKVYRERASLLLLHHGESLPLKRRLNLELGLEQRTLFGVSPCKNSCRFTISLEKSKNSFTNINNMFSIALTKEGIDELNRMGCNYQSIYSKHKNFNIPYKIGECFHFTAHQFRHTFAWFIVANRLGDLDDIKYQYKHLENMMSLVYSQRGYESMEELMNVADSFYEFMLSQTMEDMVTAAQDGLLAGKGGQNFTAKLTEILSEDLTTGSAPHFNNMQELLDFAAKHTNNFRGLSHGYCTKGSGCKVRNAADPSHCVSCDSYIATPRHLPHWIVIKKRCESQLVGFEKLPSELKQRFKAFSTALKDNLEAANIIINQLTIKVKEA